MQSMKINAIDATEVKDVDYTRYTDFMELLKIVLDAGGCLNTKSYFVCV